MANWALPTVGSLYVNYTAELAARDVSIALMFDSNLVNDTNIVTGTKRWNVSNNNWEKYASGTWSALAAVYGISISGSAGSVPYAGVSGKPSTISGWGITDAYTKTETNNLLNNKANLASPTFTGTPLSTTPSSSDNSKKIATTEFVKAQQYLTIDSAAIGPVALDNSVSTRYFYSSYLYSDGTIKEWGHGAQGQLAQGTVTTGCDKVTDAGFIDDVSGETFIKLFTSFYHKFALTASGKVYAAGTHGASGAMGTGTTAASTTFTLLTYFTTNNITITDISAGGSNAGVASGVTLFLSSNGDVYIAGRASKGDGTAIADIITPVQVIGLPSGIIGIYCGGNSASNSCFAWTNSTLYSWSRSNSGGSGQNIATAATNRPVQSVLSGSVVKVISEGNSTLATTWVLLANGEVWATGYNASGQIGDNTTTQSNVFKKVASLSGIVDITSSGGANAAVMARNASGQVWVWGYLCQYMITGVNGNLLLPTLISGTWKYISGGVGCEAGTCGYFLIDTNNRLYFTGFNATSCSGIASGPYSASSFRGIPTLCTLPKLLDGEYPVEAIVTHIYSLTPYYADSAMLTNKKRLFTVGYNGNGELGIGDKFSRTVFTEVRI